MDEAGDLPSRLHAMPGLASFAIVSSIISSACIVASDGMPNRFAKRKHSNAAATTWSC